MGSRNVAKKIMTIKEKMYGIIASKTDLLPSDLRDSDKLEDLGADSLDVIDIVLECEHEFNIIISEDTVQNLKTVGEYVSYIEKELKGDYHKFDKPHGAARKPVRIKEARNENWYQ